MAALNEITTFLHQYLRCADYHEGAVNGLQVDAGKDVITRIALAVDASESIIEKAITQKADLLLVHHGLFWGESRPLHGVYGKKIRALMTHRCSLAAYHLPLDGHEQVGNGAELARFLGATPEAPFCEGGSPPVGVFARFAQPVRFQQLVERARNLVGVDHLTQLQFGTPEISTALVVTGAAGKILHRAPENGVDIFISGEPRHQCYIDAQEHHTNALFVGHYASETFGVRALGATLAAQCGVTTFFIDESTGI